MKSMGSSFELFYIWDFSRKDAKEQRGKLLLAVRFMAGEISIIMIMPYEVADNELISRKGAKAQRGWNFGGFFEE